MGTTSNVLRGILFAGATTLLGACAASPPPAELVRARAAFQRARGGEAGRRAPAALYDAQLALNRAEESYLDDGPDPRTRDLAYIAERRAQIAEARGRTMAAQADERSARGRIERAEDAQRRSAEARAQMAEQAANAERMARAQAERRAAAAYESLRQMANVRQEPDRTIITLSGEVLFPTGQASLLPNAQQRLDAVAQSLLDAGFGTVSVEGHTDSRGSTSSNDALSLSRAQAVRSYLVSRGVPDDRIQAVGHGEARPVADNATPDGRANNRRVELVVTPSGESR